MQEYGADLLTVDGFGDRRAAVADEAGDVPQWDSGVREQRDEAVVLPLIPRLFRELADDAEVDLTPQELSDNGIDLVI